VSLWLHLFENVSDLTVGANDESGAGNTHHFAAVHILFFDHAEGFADLLFGVGEQGIRQIVFLLKFLLRGRFVGRNTENDRACILQLLV